MDPVSCSVQEFVRLCFVIYLVIDGFKVFVKLVTKLEKRVVPL